MLIINTIDQDAAYNFNLMHHCLVPRPVFLISTYSTCGYNVAPYSYVNGCSHSPPAVSVAIHHKENGELKDTLLNIRETGHFLLNAVNRTLLEKANRCAENIDRCCSEFDEYNIEYVFREGSNLPHVLESPFTLYCELIDEIPIGDKLKGSSLIIAGIKYAYFKKDAINESDILCRHQSKIVGRLGTNEFFMLDEIFSTLLPRE